jgi:hypothetical protein
VNREFEKQSLDGSPSSSRGLALVGLPTGSARVQVRLVNRASRRAWCRLFAAAVVAVLAGLVGLAGDVSRDGRVAAEEPSTKDAKTVEVTVDYGDGAQRRYVLPYREGSTLLQVMEAVQMHPRGVSFKYRGRAETAFLTEIDQVQNEGRGRNWLYRVNDLKGEESFGVHRVAPGDRIVWKFEKFGG